MKVETYSLNDIEKKISNAHVIKKKRERCVYYYDGNYYKLWVPNWTQGDITKYALDCGFYCEENASALTGLIYDDTGQRGYITKEGTECAVQMGDRAWEKFIKATTLVQRLNFMSCLLEKSLKVKGMYVDLVPTNLVFVDGEVSLIDLDSFNSFEFIFDGKRQWYEKFELDAWWKPFETASRDVDLFYKKYFSSCLGIEIKETINSAGSIQNMMIKIKNKYEI
tara:strand:+ start:10 stop:678 length:669 start_codon:yes stop_codon:yes gene_type:complete